MRTDCGCGCGGTSARPSAFVRPRFFAGQLLTEDDLGLLVDYMTGKSKLHNRSLYGPGVVCGLEVSCDPCGGGKVVVHPGHALDCAGNDIVLSCKEQVDVQALVRELRVSSLGVDCVDPCDDDGERKYGLYVRYEELSVEPVTPYATEEPCPSPGCVPSRVREAFKFVVKCDTTDDHRHNPGTKLLNSLGPLERYEQAKVRDLRFGQYIDAMHAALAGEGQPVRFDATDAERYKNSLKWLRESGEEGTPEPRVAREMTEHVRALASGIARFDTHDAAGQRELTGKYDFLARIKEDRATLKSACERLAGTDTDTVWPNPLHRSIARAVVAETMARVVPDGGDPDGPLEVRLVAQGTPVSQALQVEFRSDLSLIREWLLGRLEQATSLADCSLRKAVSGTEIPHLLPPPEPGSTQRVTRIELEQIAVAAGKLSAAVRRFVSDAACSTLNPPCSNCSDTDVLLAHVELDDCDVVRICSATREQVLPGGSVYGEWLPKLYRLRELAERVCCQPAPTHKRPSLSEGEQVAQPYRPKLLEEWPRTGDLEQMLSLLLTPAPGETPPKAIHEQVYTTPSEVTDSLHELAVLRAQVTDLTAALEGLRGQLGSAQEQMTQVREQLPERLESRLEELESAPTQEPSEPAKPAPPRRRSTRTQKPGEST